MTTPWIILLCTAVFYIGFYAGLLIHGVPDVPTINEIDHDDDPIKRTKTTNYYYEYKSEKTNETTRIYPN